MLLFGESVGLEMDAFQLQAVTSGEVLIDRMGSQQGTVGIGRNDFPDPAVELEQLALQRIESLSERIGPLRPEGRKRVSDRPGLLHRQGGIEPGGKGQRAVAVPSFGTVTVDHGVADLQVAIANVLRRIDQLRLRQRDLVHPSRVPRAVEQDHVGRLVGRNGRGVGHPEGRVHL